VVHATGGSDPAALAELMNGPSTLVLQALAHLGV
jgi:hypothetical protein